MADKAQTAAALRGDEDRMPFGVGGPAEPVVDQAGTLAGLAGAIWNIPKHLIDASRDAVPGLRNYDYSDNPNAPHPNQAMYNAVGDTAIGMLGGSGWAPAEANSLRMGIKAYHASPHEFEKFDLGKAGTGEGKADFGKGVYAAENPKVGKYYFDNFGDNAKMYHLDIDAEPHQFLDWNKPLHPAQEATLLNTKDFDVNRVVDFLKGKSKTAEDYYKAFAQASQDGAIAATEHFKNAGFPGIKYLDAGSRLKGEGTSNYVVFDPNLINILKKEGSFNPEVTRPSSPGDAFREHALKARNDYYHNDVATAQGLLQRDLDRISKGYTTPAYKGVSNLYQEANPVFADHAGDFRNLYSTSDPKLAELYTHRLDTDYYGQGSAIQPMYLNTKNYHTFDAKGKTADYVITGAKQEGMDRGAPGVILKNTWDEPAFSKTLPDPQNVYITFPHGAATAKSKFAAKFDPTDPNMLRGIGAATLGGGTALEMVNALREQRSQ